MSINYVTFTFVEVIFIGVEFATELRTFYTYIVTVAHVRAVLNHFMAAASFFLMRFYIVITWICSLK